jgi:branched-chain amino acid transport system permease protein
MFVLGGMGNIWGVALGAFVIFTIQTVLLKQLNTFFANFQDVPIIGLLSEINFVQYQFLLYGLALVLMMLFRPEGLFPSQRRKQELRAGDAAESESEAAAALGEATT